MATTSPAQDEYNALMASQAPRVRAHPADAGHSRRSSSSSATLAASTLSPGSIHTNSSTLTPRSTRLHAPRHSLASALDAPRPTSSGSFYRDSDSSDDEAEEPETPEDVPHDSSDSDGDYSGTKKGPSKYYLPAEWDRGAMTGPKGVIADAAAFEREKSGKRSSDYARTKDLKLPRAQQFGGSTSPRRRQMGSRSGSGSEGASEGDEPAVKAWRERRMQEMRAEKEKATGRKSSVGQRRDGEVKLVDAEGFLEGVDKAGRGCVVVVLITDDENPLSALYSQSLHTISTKYPSHSFIALTAIDASIDSAACPAILAYRDGEQFAQVMPLRDEVAPTCNVVTNLEMCLRSRDILGSRFDIDGF
ncbi:MAG: hypothetical protein Q9162_000873 [Coniocarpon cinnabarinum]